MAFTSYFYNTELSFEISPSPAHLVFLGKASFCGWDVLSSPCRDRDTQRATCGYTVMLSGLLLQCKEAPGWLHVLHGQPTCVMPTCPQSSCSPLCLGARTAVGDKGLQQGQTGCAEGTHLGESLFSPLEAAGRPGWAGPHLDGLCRGCLGLCLAPNRAPSQPASWR